VKRRALLRHLTSQGCVFVREGGAHTVVRNPANGLQSQVPRHREIKPTMAREICKQLGIILPTEK
jgi:predicted RNA binding protein YcfA (HicA-like mRNA interferase family)